MSHAAAAEISPGAWLTGPVPRKYPERNWSVSGKVQTPAGLVEDTIPEDQSLVLNTPEPTACHGGVVALLVLRYLFGGARVKQRRHIHANGARSKRGWGDCDSPFAPEYVARLSLG